MGDTACDLWFWDIFSQGTLLAMCEFGTLVEKATGDTACDLAIRYIILQERHGAHCLRFVTWEHILTAKELRVTLLAICEFWIYSFSKKDYGWTLLAICVLGTYSFNKKTTGDTACDLRFWHILLQKHLRADTACDCELDS